MSFHITVLSPRNRHNDGKEVGCQSFSEQDDCLQGENGCDSRLFFQLPVVSSGQASLRSEARELYVKKYIIFEFLIHSQLHEEEE
jgi:hypothetical protein